MERVLVVDDEGAIVDNLRKVLTRKGYAAYGAANGRAALDWLAADGHGAEVVLLDIRMPVMNGVDTLAALREQYPEMPVIMVSALSDFETVVSCMKGGAFGFIPKPVDFAHLLTEVEKAQEHARLRRENREYHEELEKKVAEQTAEITSLMAKVEDSFLRSVLLFVDLMGLYDPFAAGHAKRVALLAQRTARQMRVNAERQQEIEIAGLLHDIGRIGMPERLLHAPYEDLTENERTLMREQTIQAEKLLSSVPRFKGVGAIVRSHLERYDGAGFPDQMRGSQIPLGSRIVSVANAYDEMLHRRRFSREELGGKADAEEYARSALKRDIGKRFDQQTVAVFLNMLDEMALARKKAHKVTLPQLKEGMVLAANLYDDQNRLLLAEGNELSASQIAKLQSYHRLVAPLKGNIVVMDTAGGGSSLPHSTGVAGGPAHGAGLSG